MLARCAPSTGAPRSPGSRQKRVCVLASAADGSAAIELAVGAPMLALILSALVDVGQGFYQLIQVQNAAQAGAQYALRHGWDSASIQNAVLAATTLATISASPVPSQSCGCPAGNAITTVACGSSCSDGTKAGTYVTVNARSPYTPMLPFSPLGSSLILSAQAAVRIW